MAAKTQRDAGNDSGQRIKQSSNPFSAWSLCSKATMGSAIPLVTNPLGGMDGETMLIGPQGLQVCHLIFSSVCVALWDA